MDILGIDIGGGGIKGAVVDAETGELLTKRRRIPDAGPVNAAGCDRCGGGACPPFQLGRADGLHVPGGDS